ncbi:DUF1631 domain-containing protein [Ketobacter sp. MCCC 1A13808]|uniref:DUF1631 domain-containing protein n=1 Tax=Ketobacter sp. MCCC 1A13808 TaxID=2602738 RepID=UPI0012EC139D|nr:DUF1631 domain-containing protein [Ketobacter sp. MCCC 1A13808]MVF10541.1 DUF1631 domain-containing protein [Ketobacter sp. MCCC 1A13808]
MSDSDKRNRRTSSVSAAVPTLIKQVKDNSFAILTNNFSKFFSSCDDLFFDLASKASSNNEQNLYFDSMREVRMKKQKVWKAFKIRYEINFRELTKNRTQSNSPFSAAPGGLNSLSSMQLVEKDDMEQDVAITGIVNRARIDNQELIYQLNCRFDYLMPDVKVSEANNPLDPAQICAAISDSLKELELDIKCKVILLKHLDRTVIVELRNIYSLANELLVKAGILPQIGYTVQKHPSAAQSPAAVPQVTEQSDHYGVDGQEHMPTQNVAPATAGSGTTLTLGQVLNMFGQLRQNGVTDNTLISRPVSARSAPIPQQILIDSLTNMQLSSQYLQAPQEYNIRAVVERILDENRKSGREDALNESDEDIINLVAMFFDFVLDDRNLPVPFQALISRLQIPILKVALKDKQFFTNNDHPARRLINEIAASAVGWDESTESSQDKLYKEVNRVVHDIIENFTGDVAIFVQALDTYQTVTKLDRNKASVLEKRTQEAARGKAKAEHARTQSNELLFDRLKNAQLPENIMTFLVKEWQKVLLYIHLKHGTDSTELLEAKQVIDQLIWAIRPHNDERSLNRLERIKSDILRKVTSGLEAVSVSGEAIMNTISLVEQTFELVLAQRLPESSLISIQPVHLMALGQGPDNSGTDWGQLTALERQRLKQQAAAKEFVTKASKIRPGTWMSYSPPNSVKTFRCKLAMITEPGESYIFVNRFGLRVFDKNLNDFAYDLQKGYVKILEAGVFFDRAMDNISDKLKKLAS